MNTSIVQLGLLICLALAFPSWAVAQRTAEQPGDQAEVQAQAESGTPHTNRLADESSPYLLQHAHNPVDWYPWGEEALEKARRENKLIFLSVGYAACHWCHVMERESFTDAEIAKFMNENFVNVKVDREERPDVDQIYMTAVQLISGNGGWPMSVFLLPDGRPFFGGTYFPARDGDRGVSTGFLTVLKQIDEVWQTQRDRVEQQADTLTTAIKSAQAPAPDEEGDEALKPSLVRAAFETLKDQFDQSHGGFSVSEVGPKFPEASNLVFLIHRMQDQGVSEEDRKAARSMLIKTLDGMISGAMYDHLGGGFHRYSVDQRWQIPHFEKMLYDNGQLLSVYAEAFQATGQKEYQRIVEGTADFVIRVLQDSKGGYYSALDADSEGEEGKFYRWTAEELNEFEQSESLKLARAVFNLQGEPNFEGEFYVPDPRMTLTEAARKRDLDYDELLERLRPARRQLFNRRSKRSRPLTDQKILTAWNGLLIAGLADAGRILQRDDWIDAAAGAAEFIEQELTTDDNRLLRSYAQGKAKLNAYIDDYAFYSSGLLALHRATGDERWLKLARLITEKQIELFHDEASGSFYFTSNDHPTLIVRTKDPADGAIPAGTSVTLENLAYLADHTKGDRYDSLRLQTLRSLVPLLERVPAAAPRATSQLTRYLAAE